MKRRIFLVFYLAASLISIACRSGPSESGPDEAATLRGKIDFINGLLSQRDLAARLLDDLSAALPDRVWLTGVSYDTAGIQAKGYAPSNTLVADYVSRLGTSSSLAEATIQSSVQRRIRNREFQEFVIQAQVKGVRGEKPPGSGAGTESGDIAALTARLEELEKVLPPDKDSGSILRQFQQTAADSGLKITKFVPGSEIPRESYSEWPISIEVTGPRQNLQRYFATISSQPRLWLIKKFSFSPISAQDPASPIRASLTAQTYFLR
jgi:hypothetical protein